jgi:predicted transposase/invertase (TIGR01784 family)
LALANETNLNPEELADLEARERYILDRQGILPKGIEERLAQGTEEGLALGMREKALEIARQLLNVLDNPTISQTTGLSVEDIQNLREE